HCDTWSFLSACELSRVEHYSDRIGCAVRGGASAIGGNSAHHLTAVGDLGDPDHGTFVYGTRVHNTGVGTALYHFDAYRTDLRVGAGSCLDHVVRNRGRDLVGTGGCRSRSDLRRCCSGGSETAGFSGTFKELAACEGL